MMKLNDFTTLATITIVMCLVGQALTTIMHSFHTVALVLNRALKHRFDYYEICFVQILHDSD